MAEILLEILYPDALATPTREAMRLIKAMVKVGKINDCGLELDSVEITHYRKSRSTFGFDIKIPVGIKKLREFLPRVKPVIQEFSEKYGFEWELRLLKKYSDVLEPLRLLEPWATLDLFRVVRKYRTEKVAEHNKNRKAMFEYKQWFNESAMMSGAIFGIVNDKNLVDEFIMYEKIVERKGSN
jgi:hypothetical protein